MTNPLSPLRRILSHDAVTRIANRTSRAAQRLIGYGTTDAQLQQH